MEAEYFKLAGDIYNACAAAIILSQLSLLWIFPKKLVLFLMVLSAVILLTPYTMTSDITWQVPALMVVMLDFFILKGEEWPQALDLLLKNVAIVGIIGLCCLAAITILSSKTNNIAQSNSDELNT